LLKLVAKRWLLLFSKDYVVKLFCVRKI